MEKKTKKEYLNLIRKKVIFHEGKRGNRRRQQNEDSKVHMHYIFIYTYKFSCCQ